MALEAVQENVLEEDSMGSATIHRSAKPKFSFRKLDVPAFMGLCLIGGASLLFYGSLFLLLFGD